jgi:glycosyltransferase involved in cell wall biosynthesis
VRFDGFVSNEELSRAFARCDVFVLPATYDAKGDVEGLGVVLLEAMIYDKPVIGSDVGGITDIVKHEETGVLVPPGDPQALADALDRLIDDPERARELGRRGRRHVDGQFAWPVIVGRWRDIYQRLADARATRRGTRQTGRER